MQNSCLALMDGLDSKKGIAMTPRSWTVRRGARARKETAEWRAYVGAQGVLSREAGLWRSLKTGLVV